MLSHKLLTQMINLQNGRIIRERCFRLLRFFQSSLVDVLLVSLRQIAKKGKIGAEIEVMPFYSPQPVNRIDC